MIDMINMIDMIDMIDMMNGGIREEHSRRAVLCRLCVNYR